MELTTNTDSTISTLEEFLARFDAPARTLLEEARAQGGGPGALLEALNFGAFSWQGQTAQEDGDDEAEVNTRLCAMRLAVLDHSGTLVSRALADDCIDRTGWLAVNTQDLRLRALRLLLVIDVAERKLFQYDDEHTAGGYMEELGPTVAEIALAGDVAFALYLLDGCRYGDAATAPSAAIAYVLARQGDLAGARRAAGVDGDDPGDFRAVLAELLIAHALAERGEAAEADAMRERAERDERLGEFAENIYFPEDAPASAVERKLYGMAAAVVKSHDPAAYASLLRAAGGAGGVGKEKAHRRPA